MFLVTKRCTIQVMSTAAQPRRREPSRTPLIRTYLAFALAVAYAPELVVALMWVGGIRPESSPQGPLWPGSWPYAVMFSYSFALIFGAVAALGVLLRAGMTAWKSGWRKSLEAWAVMALCVAGEVLHLRGFVGWKHLMK